VITVASVGLDCSFLKEFRKWVDAEWGNVDPFEGVNGSALPPPILALEDETLVGGLSFTHSSIPGTEEIALWLNTLLVAPEYRRRGIGSQLVAAAESSAWHQGLDVLYVFTGVPRIYQKLGWQVYSRAGEHTVLRKRLVCA
jgi:GNAT superfamily N-acetyltransferase